MLTGHKSAVRIVLLLLACGLVHGKAAAKPCESGYVCNIDPEHVWAADDQRCYVLLNACMWKARQCQQELVLMDKESCKERCSLPCTRNLDPVCGHFFGGHFQTFDNECVLRNYACEEEKPLADFLFGKCSDVM